MASTAMAVPEHRKRIQLEALLACLVPPAAKPTRCWLPLVPVRANGPVRARAQMTARGRVSSLNCDARGMRLFFHWSFLLGEISCAIAVHVQRYSSSEPCLVY